jgi:hypothetical protein
MEQILHGLAKTKLRARTEIQENTQGHDMQTMGIAH